MMRARRGAAFVAGGLLAATLALTVAAPRPARADALISFEVSAAARGVQAFDDDGTGARTAEADVPETTAQLRAGPVGRGFASIAWPGPLVGNAGSLLKVLQPSLPDSVRVLNDPVRAEARTGQDPPTSTFALPNVSMTATATEAYVEGTARVGTVTGEQGPSSGFQTTSAASLRDGHPQGSASSSASNISLADGTVKIAAITSTATATTDGTTGTGTATTTVSGMTIAGQSVSIDATGLHIGSVELPLNAVVSQIVNQALSTLGMEVTLGVPAITTVGASATSMAPALVITVKSSSGVAGIVLGGAQAAVTAVADNGGPAVDVSSQPVIGAPPIFPTGSIAPSNIARSPAAGGATAVPRSAALPSIVPVFNDDHRVQAGQVVLALLSAALLALGFRRLFLDTIGRSDYGCPLTESPP